MRANIILFGTSHPIQCGAKICSSIDIQKYKLFLDRIVSLHEIKLVAEEMCKAGLENNEVNETIAAHVFGKNPEITHSYIDMPIEYRHILLIDDEILSIFSIFSFDKKSDVNSNRAKLRQIISDPVRERYWLVKILNLGVWPTLFICGDEHVDNMRKLIRKISSKSLIKTYRMSDYL